MHRCAVNFDSHWQRCADVQHAPAIVNRTDKCRPGVLSPDTPERRGSAPCLYRTAAHPCHPRRFFAAHRHISATRAGPRSTGDSQAFASGQLHRPGNRRTGAVPARGVSIGRPLAFLAGLRRDLLRHAGRQKTIPLDRPIRQSTARGMWAPRAVRARMYEQQVRRGFLDRGIAAIDCQHLAGHVACLFGAQEDGAPLARERSPLRPMRAPREEPAPQRRPTGGSAQ